MDLRVDHFKGFMLVKSEHRGQPGRVVQYARIGSAQRREKRKVLQMMSQSILSQK